MAAQLLTASITVPASAVASVRASALLLPGGGGNLVPNPSFEYDTGGGSVAAGWSSSSPTYWLNSGTTILINSAGGAQGPHFLSLTPSGTSANQGVTALLAGTFQAGVTYSASVYMRGAVGGERVLLDIGAVPNESPDGAFDFSEQAITLTNVFVRYSVTWTPRVNQALARLVLRTATAAALTFRVDGAMVTPGSVAPTYFDGDTPGCRWTGTPGSSLSTNPASTAIGGATLLAGPPWWVIPRAQATARAVVSIGTPPPLLDPLAVFSAPPPLSPPNLIGDVPPFEQSSYEIQAVLGVIANELGRIDAARQALIQNFYPLTADVLLPLFEALLGLPVNPPATLAVRRQLVVTYMQRLKSEGRGIDWANLISATVGTANWNYQEHDPANALSPAAYTVNVNIPQAASGFGWPLIRDITPAHLAINEGYTGGFIVGTSVVGSSL